MERAPFFSEIARGPEGGEAWWLTADDGVRLRIGIWNRAAPRGTVLLFPGRTEFVEKYGAVAAGLARRGYATLSVDWRGQGLADRPLADRAAGHVARFGDYQRDVRAVEAAARALRLPLPFHLIAHSMGGAIGFRAVSQGLDVRSAVFSAPMWGIVLAWWMRPFARVVSGAARPVGFGTRYAPGTRSESYILSTPFEDNQLTTDRAMYDHMRSQLRAHPELVLGGPSLAWVHEALGETRALRAMAPAGIPAIAAVGGRERIVERWAMESVMRRWPGGRLDVYDDAEHEIMMERPELRERFLDRAVELFASAPERARARSVYR